MSAAPKSPGTFIDTNIWVYAFSAVQDVQKTRRSRALIRQTTNIYVNIQVINETTQNLLRKFGATEDVIRRLIRSYYRKYSVIDTTQTTLIKASSLRTHYSFSFWDSTIIASALEAQADTLFSEDLQDGLVVEGRLTIMNPLK